MTRITARFVVDLPGELLVAWADDEAIVLEQEIDEADVAIEFVTKGAGSRKVAGDRYQRFGIHQVYVYVTQEEDESPPKIKIDERGGSDLTDVSRYFSERRATYGDVAWRATNRMLRYFKFDLRTPNLFDISREHDCFKNAKWTDDAGNDYGDGGIAFGTVYSPGREGWLGRQVLFPELRDNLIAALQDPIVPSLHEEILSDAQTALSKRDLRRAILDIAIACEIAVKRKYFAEESPAGAAFDYLEDRSRVSVRVLDLIDGISLEAFGKSFREEQPGDFRNIDHLIRCRNKIAHRGELTFRNDAADWVEVDFELVADWWNSVLALFDWIDDL